MSSGIFDIIGPIMVGPSSSHTAGAARIAAVARQVSGSTPVQVDFYLHGSFAETYRGHGTDQALVGGILGLSPHNKDLARSMEMARKAGIKTEFHRIDLGDVHPNTVKIVMPSSDGSQSMVVGSSVGGGAITIHSVNQVRLEFTGEQPTLLTLHQDRPGVLASVTGALAEHNINIAFLKVLRQVRGIEASMVVETDGEISEVLLDQIRQVPGIRKAHYININRDEMRG